MVWGLTVVLWKPKSSSSCGDLFVDGVVVDGDGDEGDLGARGAAGGEEAAVDVVEGGGGDLVVVGGDELDADVVERERGVAVVGDDDADGDEAVLRRRGGGRSRSLWGRRRARRRW